MELILLCGYATLSILVGCWRRDRATSGEMFEMGARRIHALGSTATIFATMVTESSVFFAVALTLRYGPYGVAAVTLGPCAGMLALSFIAPRARRDGAVHRFISVPDYCRDQWGCHFGAITRLVFLLMLGWVVALQIKINSDLVSGMVGWSDVLCTLFSVGIVMWYLLCGGYRSVVSTDIFQSLLILVFLALPFFIRAGPVWQSVAVPRRISVDTLLLFLMSFALTITRPELWQRIYSSADGKVATRSMCVSALLYLVFGAALFYFSVAVIAANPGLGSREAFSIGYKAILPTWLALLFPVLLLAAMMSSLDSAAFLLSVELTRLHHVFRRRSVLWTRIFILVVLMAGGAVALTIFDALSFAYTINGFVALLTIPLLSSFWKPVSAKVLYTSLLIGVSFYVVQLALGRISKNPSEAVLPAFLCGGVLLMSMVLEKPRLVVTQERSIENV